MILDEALRARLTRLLPAHLLERLPDVDALKEAIRHLNGLQRALSSFLPLYIAQDHALIDRDFSALNLGTFLFADVAGFTALSETLQHQLGAEGTEILTELLNDYFATMLEVMAKSDGQLLKFAGDALLGFFPASSAPDDLHDLHKAIRTGLRMQRAIRKFQPISHPQLAQLFGEHPEELTMSVGIARGRLFEASVDTAYQRDYVIQGSLPGLAMQAEALGLRDEVIVSEALAEQIRDVFDVEPLTDGFVRVVDNLGDQLDDYEFQLIMRRRPKSSVLFDFEQQDLVVTLGRLLTDVERTARFVAPAVANQLIVSDDFHLPSAHRPITIMFMHFTGFAEALETWGDQHLPLVTSLLERCYAIVLGIVTSYGGTLTRSDPFRQGAKLLITFGAPIAHADDPERAAAAALEITHQLALFNQRLRGELPEDLRRAPFVEQRIGISQGQAFAGEVGWKQRREYTVMGDDVNLAARLMANAPMGKVWVSARVQRRIQSSFETQALPPLTIKGKRQPVHAYEIVRPAAPRVQLEIDSAMPFVGHDRLMLSLDLALRQARAGRRRAIALVGDAGIGKTRIARQAAQMAAGAGFRVAWSTCLTRGNRKSTWAALVGQLLDLPPRRPGEPAPLAVRKQMRAKLEALELADLEALFADLLFGTGVVDAGVNTGTARAASAQQEQIADLFLRFSQMTLEEMRRSGVFGTPSSARASGPPDERIELSRALVRFLQQYTLQTPILLVIDDLHLENLQALETLKAVLDGMSAGRLIVLLGFEPMLLDFELQVWPIPDLTRDETQLIASAILHVTELDPRLSDFLWERTHGRPLFIESLLRALLDGHYITFEQGRAQLNTRANPETLPEDIRELVTSRIDRLSGEAQTILRAGAVLAEDFSVEGLQALTETEDQARVREVLRELTRAQILDENQAGLYGFRHGMTQRVVYESLSRAQRLKLHQVAAAFWRRQPAADSQPIMLAHHLVKCGLLPEAIEIIMRAAELAEAEPDIDQAVEYYSYALTLLPDDKQILLQLQRLRSDDSAT